MARLGKDEITFKLTVRKSRLLASCLLCGRGWKAQSCWIPAYVGVSVNEAADRAAKEAAKCDPAVSESGVQTLTTTTKAAIHATMKDRRSTALETTKHGRAPFKLGTQLAKAVLLVHDMSSNQLSHHADADRQDRPARVSLRHRKIQHRQSGCEYSRQTVRHFLLECRNGMQERRQMQPGKRERTSITRLLKDRRR
jgi:hypothetical protein